MSVAPISGSEKLVGHRSKFRRSLSPDDEGESKGAKMVSKVYTYRIWGRSQNLRFIHISEIRSEKERSSCTESIGIVKYHVCHNSELLPNVRTTVGTCAPGQLITSDETFSNFRISNFQ